MIGILSDAHGNIGAFRSAINHLRHLGANEFYFLGDAVGYIPSIEVVEELFNMGNEVMCILGNHELMVLNQLTNPNLEPIYQHQPIRSKLTAEHIAFLKSWPTHWRATFSESNALFIHGGPNDFSNEYVYPNSNLSQYDISENFVFMGHSHYPFIKKVNTTTFVNVGSCGLPRDDGRYGSCSIFNPANRVVSIYRFSIDGATTVMPAHVRDQLHLSVLQLFDRRTPNLTGQVLTQIETKL
jgi:predicted phosphodiesterase